MSLSAPPETTVSFWLQSQQRILSEWPDKSNRGVRVDLKIEKNNASDGNPLQLAKFYRVQNNSICYLISHILRMLSCEPDTKWVSLPPHQSTQVTQPYTIRNFELRHCTALILRPLVTIYLMRRVGRLYQQAVFGVGVVEANGSFGGRSDQELSLKNKSNHGGSLGYKFHVAPTNCASSRDPVCFTRKKVSFLT